MKKSLLFTCLLLFLLGGHFCYGQYSISGYLDAPEKNKRVYLSLLRYDEQYVMSKAQVLMSTLTDSTGYFSFTGKLLANEHKLYRIHANLEEGTSGFDITDIDGTKNFHNFIFSNTDTIVFERSKGLWFNITQNTNAVDEEWQEINSYKRKLGKEFYGIKNQEARTQSRAQLLAEIKVNAIKTEKHPLVKLILLDDFPEKILKQDYKNDPEFYLDLSSELNRYYANTSYAAQFEALRSNLSISETEQQLTFFKRLVYLLSLVIFALIVIIFFLVRRVGTHKEYSEQEPVSLTKQEEKIAQLILEEKTNKEIAAELFISLSTVKTHIRNLYAKYKVSNRRQFTHKMKNQPGD